MGDRIERERSRRPVSWMVAIAVGVCLAATAPTAVGAQVSGSTVDYEAGLLDAGRLAEISSLAGGDATVGTTDPIGPTAVGQFCGETFSALGGRRLRHTIPAGTAGVITHEQTVFSNGGAKSIKRLRSELAGVSEACPPLVQLGRLSVDTAPKQPKLKKVGSGVPFAYRGSSSIPSASGDVDFEIVQLVVTEGELASYTVLLAGADAAMSDADLQQLAAATSKRLRAAEKAAASSGKGK